MVPPPGLAWSDFVSCLSLKDSCYRASPRLSVIVVKSSSSNLSTYLQCDEALDELADKVASGLRLAVLGGGAAEEEEYESL